MVRHNVIVATGVVIAVAATAVIFYTVFVTVVVVVVATSVAFSDVVVTVAILPFLFWCDLIISESPTFKLLLSPLQNQS
jgi:hypothetical protein